MAKNYFSITVEIETPAPRVWGVMTDVERWPEWTQSVSRVVRLSSGPLELGSHVRIDQPKLPRAFWCVTELTPGASFTWVSVVPGVRVTARHAVDATAGGSRVTLSIQYQGFLGPLLGRWTRHLNERYLAMEANGLKTRCAELAASPYSRKT